MTTPRLVALAGVQALARVAWRLTGLALVRERNRRKMVEYSASYRRSVDLLLGVGK